MSNKKKCFIIRPFANEFKNVWDLAIRPAIIASSLDPWDGQEERLGTNSIHKDISSQIWRSELVVADLTGRNPNVMYELGLAHAAKKPVIMLLEEEEDPPFDIRHIRYLTYNKNNLMLLQNSLVERIQSTIKLSESEIPDFFPELSVMTDEILNELNYLRSKLVQIEVSVFPKSADIFFNDKLVGNGSVTIYLNNMAIRNTISASTVGFYEYHAKITEKQIRSQEINIRLDYVYQEGINIIERAAIRLPSWLRDRRRDPLNPALMRAIGNYLLLAKERRDALEEIEELLTIAPEWHLSFLQRGFYHGVAGEVEEAIPWYHKATALCDYHYIGNYNLACNYSLIGELDTSLYHLEQIINNDVLLNSIREANSNLSRDPDFKNLWENVTTKNKYREIELILFPNSPNPEESYKKGIQGYIF